MLGLTQPPLQAGFKTPPAMRYTSVIMEKCVSPDMLNRIGNILTMLKLKSLQKTIYDRKFV